MHLSLDFLRVQLVFKGGKRVRGYSLGYMLLSRTVGLHTFREVGYHMCRGGVTAVQSLNYGAMTWKRLFNLGVN